MKKICLFAICILLQGYAFAQKSFTDNFRYKVTYEMTYQPDSTDNESVKSEAMVLYIGDEISRFSSAGKAIGDSLKATLDGSNFDLAAFMRMREKIPKTSFEYYIYMGVPAQKFTYVQEIVQDKYFYTEDKDLFDWKVLDETDTIAGYLVQKATTSFAGRDYTAWFTQEIPFAEGPYKFNGLPGLIVKIGDDKGHYLFELKQIQNLDNPIPFTIDNEEFIETTPQKLLEIENQYRKDPVAFVERSVPGVKIQYGANADKKKIERNRKERLKKENNPIELE